MRLKHHRYNGGPLFYGDIVSDWWGAWQEEDQYPDAIKNFLAEANGRDLNIYINSGGGSVFAGIAIYNMLKRYQGKKHCFVDALAGSIASLFRLWIVTNQQFQRTPI